MGGGENTQARHDSFLSSVQGLGLTRTRWRQKTRYGRAIVFDSELIWEGNPLHHPGRLCMWAMWIVGVLHHAIVKQGRSPKNRDLYASI